MCFTMQKFVDAANCHTTANYRNMIHAGYLRQFEQALIGYKRPSQGNIGKSWKSDEMHHGGVCGRRISEV